MKRYITSLVAFYALLRINSSVPGVTRENVFRVTAATAVSFADALIDRLKEAR